MGDLDPMVPWAHPSPQSKRYLDPIASAVFAGLASVRDRPTDHATLSLTMIDHISNPIQCVLTDAGPLCPHRT